MPAFAEVALRRIGLGPRRGSFPQSEKIACAVHRPARLASGRHLLADAERSARAGRIIWPVGAAQGRQVIPGGQQVVQQFLGREWHDSLRGVCALLESNWSRIGAEQASLRAKPPNRPRRPCVGGSRMILPSQPRKRAENAPADLVSVERSAGAFLPSGLPPRLGKQPHAPGVPTDKPV